VESRAKLFGHPIHPMLIVLPLGLLSAAVAFDGALGYVLSFGGLALASVTGWLGGKLVDRLGVGVDPGANLDSPRSLSGKPADARTESQVGIPG
jgi:uncharacterized membrane protein